MMMSKNVLKYPFCHSGGGRNPVHNRFITFVLITFWTPASAGVTYFGTFYTIVSDSIVAYYLFMIYCCLFTQVLVRFLQIIYHIIPHGIFQR